MATISMMFEDTCSQKTPINVFRDYIEILTINTSQEKNSYEIARVIIESERKDP